jgi:hypothetical protein
VEGVPEALTNAWLTSVATNPLLGAAGMVLLVITLNYVKHFFPALIGGGGSRPAEPEPARGRSGMEEVVEHAHDIVEELKRQNEIQRRLVESMERAERSLLELIAHGRASAPPARRAPRSDAS